MLPETKLRLGISMRITVELAYDEKRDSLARDWSTFMLREFPMVDWIYLPNIENSVEHYCKRWNINGFILSGGEDIGIDKERDNTEIAILEYARSNNLPLLGICRGLQLIFQYYGGSLEDGSDRFLKAHCSTSHYVLYETEKILVNSYHKKKLIPETLPPELRIKAVCASDHSIEAVSGENLLGIMWHPEREQPYKKWNTELIRSFFGLKSPVKRMSF